MSNLKLATELAVLHHALVGAAEEMGEALKRSAFSPNIKERQDYSCALFDAKGRLLAQAAHLPVHLGSMPASVHAVIEHLDLGPGDYAIVNDPYNGGTHLPDITMVAPVFKGSADARLLGYAASRAHHADIGGASPGSMSPQVDLFAEGLVIPPVKVKEAECLTDAWSWVLANTRTPTERQGDLMAQFAACDRGIRRMAAIVQRFGAASFTRLRTELVRHSASLMRENLRSLKRGTFATEDRLDDDGAGAINIPIRVKLKVTRDKLAFDFSESAEQVRGGINAVRAVTESAAFYSVLCFCDSPPPINHGCFECIEVVTKPGTVVDAIRPAPVAGGNVETSQRIVDVCLSALALAAQGRVAAQSQGTMNNLSIGGRGPGGHFTYYETIAGGCGGAPGRPGADATHSHMTNTLNTPIEALEHSYPMRVDEYSLRVGSAGSGAARGGAGVLRRVRVLAPAEFALLTERRLNPPQGADGGDPGSRGENRLVDSSGRRTRLPPKCAGILKPGESIEIRTPGGGGHGRR